MLEFDWPTLLFQILNFVALLLILNHLVFKPLRAKLTERGRTLSDTLQAAQDQEAEAARMRRDWEIRRNQAEREAEEIIHAAELEAERRAAHIIEEARIRLDHISEEMRDDLVRQRDEILARHYDEVLNTVMALAGNVVQAVTTRRAHDDLVTNFCASIFQIPQPEIEVYRHMMAGRMASARVETPVALSDEQAKTLTDTLSSLIDQRVELQVTINPALIAGISVRLADRLIDNSVRQQLLGIRERVRADLMQHAGA
jgi:F-type H+-transporting ATPase subunit b